MNTGFIYLHRTILSWEWYDDANVVRLFLHLLLKANWQEKKWHGITIKRGSFITSRKHLAKETGLSVQQVRSSLDKLKSTSEITIKTTNKYTVVSINNYDSYQSNNQQTNQQITNNQPTNNQQITTTNNINNNNNYNKKRKTSSSKGKRLPKGNELTQTDFEDIAEKYQVPMAFVLSKWDDLQNYCHSKNKRYSNFKRTLMNFVKSDALKIKKDHNERQQSKSSIAYFEE